jgi:hypothetical protein
MPHHNATHGHTPSGRKSREYRSWDNMRQRCNNPKHHYFPKYGGRGVKVCDRWLHSFEAFLADMGPRPPGTTLDRFPDKNGNYEPANCRWATPAQQQRNTRYNVIIEFQGRRMCLMDWSKELGVSFDTLHARFRYGWSVERAFTTPVQRHRPR